MTIKRITAFSIHTTGEGERAAYTYSIIDENGSVIASNKRAEVILVDENALDAANTLYRFLKTKIPE
jgi:hypothetical protein